MCRFLSSVAPRFQRRPTSIAADVRSDVEFACDVYGNPPPAIEWLKNGEVIISSNYFQVSDGGRRLNILGLVPSDQGMYQCLAENDVGSIQASARLSIRQATGAMPSLTSLLLWLQCLPVAPYSRTTHLLSTTYLPILVLRFCSFGYLLSA